MSSPDYAKLGFTAIRVELDNSVAVVTLARSKQFVHSSVITSAALTSQSYNRRNTFSAELVDDLIKSFDLFDRDDRVRVVVLTAEPTAPAFCAGVSADMVRTNFTRRD